MVKVDWLDRLVFREIEVINEKEKRFSNFMFLMIEFPKITAYGIEYSVIYYENVCISYIYFYYSKLCVTNIYSWFFFMY